MTLETDEQQIVHYLDNAILHQLGENEWAEGYWIGRAVEYASQNALDYNWLVEQWSERGLDAAVIAVPKPGDPDPRAN